MRLRIFFRLAPYLISVCGGQGFHARAETEIPILFESHCLKCHGADKPKGGVDLRKIVGDFDTDESVSTWRKVVEVLDFGMMPPPDANQPAAELKRQTITWIQGELTKSNAAVDLEALRNEPKLGNRIDHEALFSGKHKGPAWSPSRLWRLSPFISTARYGSIHTQLGKHLNKASQPFGLKDEPGIRDFAGLHRIDIPTLELLLLNADQLVQNQIGPNEAELEAMDKHYIAEVMADPKLTEKQKKGKIGRTRPSNKLRRWLHKDVHAFAHNGGTPPSSQMELVVRAQFQLHLGRQPNGEEIKRYVRFLREAVKEGGNLEGVRAVSTTIALLPETIYRMELGLGKELPDGRRSLSARELGYAVSYALRDVGPDKLMRPDVESGALLNPEVLAAHIERIYDEEFHGNYSQHGAPRVLRFFQEFFGYPAAIQVFKDGSRFPGHRHQPDRLVEDTDQLVLHILRRDKDVLRQLLTTDIVAVHAHNRDYRLTHDSYGLKLADIKARVKAIQAEIEKSDDKNLSKTQLPNRRAFFRLPGQRTGILTQPSWLAAHSQNFDNDPVLRGKWIYERLLAGNVPDVPVTVDATVPATPDQTLRQRFHKTREQYCWNCHGKMNPLGMAFEAYDDVGRFRDKGELLRDNETLVPVLATGAIPHSGEPGLDGEVADALELMRKLGNSSRARQSFLRHAFRYWMGRNERLHDSPTLQAAERAYLDSGGSMKALVVSLLTSDSFLYRRDFTEEASK